MIDFISIDKVIETELNITATIKPKPFSSNDQEVVVIYRLSLFIEFGTINRVDKPLVV